MLVWDLIPKLGKKQQRTQTARHNSGWVQSPGVEFAHPARHDELSLYVQGVIRAFRSDKAGVGVGCLQRPDNMTARL